MRSRTRRFRASSAATLHRRVAEWIADSVPDRQAETTEVVAYHYEQALAYGEQDDELERRSFDALLAAGDGGCAPRSVRLGGAICSSRALEIGSDRRVRVLMRCSLAGRVDIATRAVRAGGRAAGRGDRDG